MQHNNNSFEKEKKKETGAVNFAALRDDFPLLKNRGVIYLDNGATTQKPQSVIDAMAHFYTYDNANIHRGIYELSQKSTQLFAQARESVARFINAQTNEIIFTSGTTDSLNALARSLGKNIKEGDEIVLTAMEHHSNIVCWQQLAREKKAVLKYIPLTSDYRIDMNQAAALITPKTKIVSVTHISNVLGTINPIKELGEIAHKNDALLIVDAAQSAPHIPLDVEDLGCDFLAFSGHKMCGPTGIGVLFGKAAHLATLEPFSYGGSMIGVVNKQDSTWADVPYKFEAGTPPIAQAIGLMRAVEYLERVGMKNIEEHCHELTSYALERLSTLNGLRLIGSHTAQSRVAIFSFVIDGMHPHDLGELLDRKGFALRGGTHCTMPLHKELGLGATMRASFYFYNTKEEVDTLVGTLGEIMGQDGKQETMSSLLQKRNEITSEELNEEQEIYKENVIDHYKHPHNKRELKEATLNHKEHNPLCGDTITLYLKIEGEKIVDVSFMGEGCVISQASASLLTDHLHDKTLEQVQEMSKETIFSLLGIPISHTRIKCALLSLKVVHAGVEQYNGTRNR